MGTWESTGTPEISEFDCRGQKTLHWGVIYIIQRLSKCRCRKWARMSHLDICSTSYGKKKSRESNCQSRESTRPQCVQVLCNTPLESSRRDLQVCFRPHLNQRSEQRVITLQSGGSLNRDSFGTPKGESWDKKPFRCRCRRETQKILYGGRWWFPSSLGPGESCAGLINLCVLFLVAQSAPNKGSVDAQNKTYAHSLCLRRQQRSGKCMSCHRMYFLGSKNIFVFLDTPRGP
jgi:hypothetical protein